MAAILSRPQCVTPWNYHSLVITHRGDFCLQFRWQGPWFNIKMSSYQYRKSHCGDKMILRPSYLHNGISYTSKTTSLYWIGAKAFLKGNHHLNQCQLTIDWTLNSNLIEIQWNFIRNSKQFLSRKYIEKCVQNGRHFIQAFICYS